jgi:ketosteroid isomerase-like protein
MDEAWHDFDRFMKRRAEAAQSYVNGDAAPLGRIVTQQAPATFFGPKGDVEKGPEHVFSVYESDATHFVSGETDFEILHVGASGDLAYWVGLQHARARLQGKPGDVPMSLRVTEIFRRENGAWKLVHRHADLLKADVAGAPKHRAAGGSAAAGMPSAADERRNP